MIRRWYHQINIAISIQISANNICQSIPEIHYGMNGPR